MSDYFAIETVDGTPTLQLLQPFPAGMTTAQARALSAEKWETVAAWYEAQPDEQEAQEIENLGAPSCALCSLFLAEMCYSCPVALNTMTEGCRYTPLDMFWHAIHVNHAACIDVALEARKEAAYLRALEIA